ncbi:unnamed protein product [Oncorhynchus mykiss]|uniref:RING-type domain-containing protein n=4 Tax=Oncorhynchus mykiss TaxID=8022 RepID=A0A060VNY0_ONCMY|nr:unnamed protein product [Oncorhynchus mykiss]
MSHHVCFFITALRTSTMAGKMAGGVLSPLDNLCGVDCSNVHPLFCHLCHEQYQHPCLLDCYHIFCARCLQGRANESRLNCPLCG